MRVGDDSKSEKPKSVSAQPKKRIGFGKTLVIALSTMIGLGAAGAATINSIEGRTQVAQKQHKIEIGEQVSQKNFQTSLKYVDNFKQVIYQKTSKLMKLEADSKVKNENDYINNSQFDKGLKNFMKYLIEHEKIKNVPNSALDMMTASQSNKYDLLEGMTKWEIRKIILDNINVYYDFVHKHCTKTIDTTNLNKLFSEGNIMIRTDNGQAVFSLYEGKVINHWKN